MAGDEQDAAEECDVKTFAEVGKAGSAGSGLVCSSFIAGRFDPRSTADFCGRVSLGRELYSTL